ncbi:MAG: NAD-dependent epimerase/dehydratase family protein [Candidatus Bipolaricaulaceae bacterium]
MTKILVTGATGQIGTELTLVLREKHGGENVVAAGHKKPPHPKLLETGPFVTLDVTDRAKLAQAVQEWRITEIYHLAAVLSATGEQNPGLAWQVNMEGLYNVLEVARNFGVQKIFWPSSIAVFGPNTPKDNTPQDTILSPTTMYGITKVAGELLCTYYYQRYGLDVRGLRFPGIISSETPPGGGTTDYAVEIFYHAVRGEPYTCFVRPDTVLPMMYMPDGLRATLQLMEADPARLRYRIYNVTGMSFSAEELAREIQKRVPGFFVEYKPDFRQKIADSWPKTIDDSAAREDWGWKPAYTLTTMVDDMLTALRKKREQGES